MLQLPYHSLKQFSPTLPDFWLISWQHTDSCQIPWWRHFQIFQTSDHRVFLIHIFQHVKNCSCTQCILVGITAFLLFGSCIPFTLLLFPYIAFWPFYHGIPANLDTFQTAPQHLVQSDTGMQTLRSPCCFCGTLTPDSMVGKWSCTWGWLDRNFKFF